MGCIRHLGFSCKELEEEEVVKQESKSNPQPTGMVWYGVVWCGVVYTEQDRQWLCHV